MSDTNDITNIIKKELQKSLDEVFGPLLVEVAKNIKGLQSSIGSPEENPLLTELVAIKLQSQLIKAQLNDISQKIGLSPIKSIQQKQTEAINQSASNFTDEKLKNIFQEEITQINEFLMNEFQNIDKTLARFFKKVVSDNKLILDELLKLKGDFVSNKTEVIEKKIQEPSQPSYRSPKYVPESLEETKPVSTPSVTKEYKPVEPASPVASSTYSSMPLSPVANFGNQDVDADIQEIHNVIQYFGQGNINPKDAIFKIEQLRDSIIAERVKEAPYRVTASRTLREAIFALNREKGRGVLTDGTTTQVIKLLEVLLEHVQSI
ncbi:MAG: hypothetical protein ACFFD1_00630 [Candidatus Thorarchaeota archaeon]